MAPPKIRLPLTALRTFECAARRLSFKDAAEELHVSATTVSNQIRELEREWNCILFIRKTRQVVLTDAGRSLAVVISRAFGDIRSEVEAYAALPRKTVTLAVGPILGTRWLTPRLSAFYRLHPRLTLTIMPGPRITSVDTLNSSIAIDWGTGDWKGLESRHIMNVTYQPVMSPELLKSLAPLRKPEDLAQLTIIHQNDRSEWFNWFRLAGVPAQDFARETTIHDSNVVTQAAIEGLGVALGVFPLIQGEVDAGRLVCPFDIKLSPTRSYHILTRPGARNDRDIRTVCEWIESEARQMQS